MLLNEYTCYENVLTYKEHSDTKSSIYYIRNNIILLGGFNIEDYNGQCYPIFCKIVDKFGDKELKDDAPKDKIQRYLNMNKKLSKSIIAKEVAIWKLQNS